MDATEETGCCSNSGVVRIITAAEVFCETIKKGVVGGNKAQQKSEFAFALRSQWMSVIQRIRIGMIVDVDLLLKELS